MEKTLTYNSYGSLIVSLLTMPLFFLLLYGFVPINFRVGIVLIGIMILATFVLGVKACFNDNEKNYLAVISFFLGGINAGVFGVALMMSQMTAG